MDLRSFLLYHFRVREKSIPVIQIQKGLPIMKLAIRIFALSVVFAGAAAATYSSSTRHIIATHQSATASLPVPGCVPGLPTCSIEGK
jgi:hypothetical protein